MHLLVFLVVQSSKLAPRRWFLTRWEVDRQAPNGFELASLEKLAETKSTKLPGAHGPGRVSLVSVGGVKHVG